MGINLTVLPCDSCGAPSAMMIIAPEAHTRLQLEDYAQMLMWTVPELKVPTWVIGTQREVLVDGKLAGEALVLKLWQLPAAAQILYSTELNAIFTELMKTHCRPSHRGYH